MKRRGMTQRPSGSASRRSTESEGRALVDAWQSSGLPVSEFCRTQGIGAHRVHYWKRRLAGGSGASDSRARKSEAPAFFAVDLESSGLGVAREGGREGSIAIWAGSDVRIEIPSSAPREAFIRALRWTVEAMQS